jgi:transcriptional regulator with XRE-family HTH domain
MTPSDETAVHKGLVASRVVEALCKGRGITVEDLAESIGMKRSTIYNRLNKGDWKFTELVAAAQVLDEPISSFMDGLGGRFTAPDTSQDPRSDTRR